jgi:hypothetical protein
MATMATRDYIALLRGLAAEKGYRVERAVRHNHWRLIDDDGKTAINPHTRSSSFTLPAALQFLGESKLMRRRPV